MVHFDVPLANTQSAGCCQILQLGTSLARSLLTFPQYFFWRPFPPIEVGQNWDGPSPTNSSASKIYKSIASILFTGVRDTGDTLPFRALNKHVLGTVVMPRIPRIPPTSQTRQTSGELTDHGEKHNSPIFEDVPRSALGERKEGSSDSRFGF